MCYFEIVFKTHIHTQRQREIERECGREERGQREEYTSTSSETSRYVLLRAFVRIHLCVRVGSSAYVVCVGVVFECLNVNGQLRFFHMLYSSPQHIQFNKLISVSINGKGKKREEDLAY